MIEYDKHSIGDLLESKGVIFRELSVRDNILRITLPDMDYVPLENVLYVSAIIEALGISGAYLTVNNRTLFLEKE